MYNVREHRVHLTEASPIDFVQNVHFILWTFWGYHVQPGVSVLKTTELEIKDIHETLIDTEFQ